MNYPVNQTSIQQGNKPATTYPGIPNGMLFVDGIVTSPAGTVQRDTQLSVAATGDVSITNNITIHATVMAPNGEFRVDYYNSGSPRGIATLLGGVIENTYGAFGTFSQNKQSTGYGRNFVYDTRMGRGMAPPFFPAIGNVISTLSGVNDRSNWRQTT